MTRRFKIGLALWVGAAFLAGLTIGFVAGRGRIMGYDSYQDCVIHEVRDAGRNAGMLGKVIAKFCNDYPDG